jgi:hypothetical protein
MLCLGARRARRQLSALQAILSVRDMKIMNELEGADLLARTRVRWRKVSATCMEDGKCILSLMLESFKCIQKIRGNQGSSV